ncbi:MAG: hypothetical protein WB608_16215 [Terracidiphilus sp.]
MATSTARSTADSSLPSPLYHHRELGAFECMGCYDMIEIPRMAVLKAGCPRVPIQGSPENLAIWTELQELDHQPCMSFSDACQAQQHREHRKTISRPTRHDL